MLGGLEELLKEAEELARGARSALIIHHDEADGVCSAALTSIALEGAGLRVRRACLDKLFPELLPIIYSSDEDIVIFTDLGSAHAPKISKARRAKPTIILDHHDPLHVQDEGLVNVNPELVGYSGEADASASTIAYLFGLKMSRDVKKYAHLALIGAFELGGSYRGFNSIAVEDAVQSGLYDVETSSIMIDKRSMAVSRASTLISVLASVGYYRGGPELAVEFCLSGFPESIRKQAEQLEEERRALNRKLLYELRRGKLQQGTWVQWFNTGDLFKEMSGKVLGSFCSYLRHQGFVNPNKYLVGFMSIPRHVPGLGELSADYTKLSARTGIKLERQVREGRYPPLSSLIAEACEALGGFGDGHSVAASGIIPRGAELRFIAKFEELVSKYMRVDRAAG